MKEPCQFNSLLRNIFKITNNVLRFPKGGEESRLVKDQRNFCTNAKPTPYMLETCPMLDKPFFYPWEETGLGNRRIACTHLEVYSLGVPALFA